MKIRALLLAVAVVSACSKSEPAPTGDSAATATQDQTQHVSITASDLDGFQKGLAEEIRLVKEGQARAAKATTPTERGNAIQSVFEENTSREAVPKSGLTFERYHLVRDVMSRLLTTLDFQDKIPGPQSVDTLRADSAMRARLHSDPYVELDAASAELVKSRLNAIAPMWIQYTTLTVAGG
jgi:hypothetical protein